MLLGLSLQRTVCRRRRRTYTVQYELASQADFSRYESDHAPAMRQKGLEKFGTKALAFRSTMRVLAQGALRDQ